MSIRSLNLLSYIDWPETVLRLAFGASMLLYASITLGQTTFTVNVDDDRADFNAGDGTCAIEPFIFPSECSLRAALQEANATSGAVVIEFSDNLPTDSFGRSVIRVESELPSITNRVTIDGASRTDYVGGSRQPRIVIRYLGGSAGVDGLVFAAGSSRSTVRAVSIENFPDNGIEFSGGDRYTVEECNIGLAWHPAAVSNNGNGGFGIVLSDASSSGGPSVIRNNLIAYNGDSGIQITNESEVAVLQGNIIGLRPPVQTESRFIPAPAAGNGEYGVHVTSTAGSSNFIGLIEPNTISNNLLGEIRIDSNEQVVVGNLVGLPHEFKVAPGYSATDYGRGDMAIAVTGSGNVIGGGIVANANHIGNAGSVNLYVGHPLFSSGNEILSNFIGVMPDGTDVSATGDSRGIWIDSAEDTLIDRTFVANHAVNIVSNGLGTEIRRSTILNGETGVLFDRPGTLGSDSLSSANVIGENSIGVLIRNDSSGLEFPGLTLIRYNFIGTTPDGDDLGNDQGVRIDKSSQSNEFGGRPVSIQANVIGFSVRSGIRMSPRSSGSLKSVRISRNFIGVHPSGHRIPNRAGILMRANSAGSISDVTVGHGVSSEDISGDLGNYIAYNLLSAVELDTNTGDSPRNVSIRGNRIFGNGKGIDLGPGGDTVDPGDGDTGPNDLQNYPEFDEDNTFIDLSSGELQYRFRVQTSAAIDNAYPLLIDFYLADGQLAQGRVYIGTVVYEEEDAQQWVSGSFSPAISVPVTGSFLVATASRRFVFPFVPTLGQTSEFTAQAVSLEPDLPLLVLQPEALNFGDQPVGMPTSASFLVQNQGDAALVLGTMDISGAHAGDFSILAPNTCDGATIAVGLSCLVEVAFSPSKAGIRRAEISIASNDPGGPGHISLEGTSGVLFADGFE